MKTLKLIAIGAALMSLAPLASCSQEDSPAAPAEAVMNPDGTYNVTLYIPFGDTTPATRLTYDANPDEAKVQDLWLCAFAADGGETKVEQLYSSETEIEHTSTDNNYTEKTVTLKEGKYHVYVLANVNEYLGSSPITGNTNEQTIKDICMGFSGKLDTSNKNGVKVSHLPMACINKDIKPSKGGTAIGETGTIEIGKDKDNTIVAEMTLLCAKVRYTVLFDFETATEFKSLQGVDYDKVEAKKVRLNTYLTTDKESSPYSTQDFEINMTRYKVTATEAAADGLWSKYLNMPDASSATEVPDSWPTANQVASASEWDNTNDKKRVWQGMVYLPENITDTHTTINFTSTTGKIGTTNKQGQDIGTFDLSLIRGNYYDIVAILKSPSEYYYSVTVYVKVNPWVYNPSTPVEW